MEPNNHTHQCSNHIHLRAPLNTIPHDCHDSQGGRKKICQGVGPLRRVVGSGSHSLRCTHQSFTTGLGKVPRSSCACHAYEQPLL